MTLRLAALLVAVSWAAACSCGGDTTPDGGTDAGLGGGRAGGSGGGAAGGTAGGAAGGAAGGSAGGATAGGAGGGGGGGGGDAGTNPLLPRLVVADFGQSKGAAPRVLIWNSANTLTTDVAAPVELMGIDAPAVALAADATNLYVVHESRSALSPIVQRWANARTLGTGATAAAQITEATLGETTQVRRVQLDAIGALWLLRSPGEVLRIDTVAAATAATGWSARYTHPNDQLGGFAFEQTNNRLFAGQVSGSGILVWNTANTKLGDAGMNDFQLSTDTVATMEIAGSRLYASFYEREVKAWGNIGTASAPRAFDYKLDADAGATASIRDQRVFNDNLVVTLEPALGGGQVLIYKQVSLTFMSRAPDIVIDHPSLDGPQRSVLGTDGTLYVLDLDGVSIFSAALTTPTFKTELTIGLASPADLLLLQ